jgi:hypothetical protein
MALADLWRWHGDPTAAKDLLRQAASGGDAHAAGYLGVTFVMIDYHGHSQELRDLDEAAEWFDEQAGSILATGGSGQAIWYGPTNAPAQLRVDIDIDVDRAALTWLPDGSSAQQLPAAEPILVLASADGQQDVIDAEHARVDVATARAAVLEYVTAGARPSSITWTTTPG